MAVLNPREEGRSGNETSLYGEKRKHRSAREGLRRTAFEPGRAGSSDTERNQ